MDPTGLASTEAPVAAADGAVDAGAWDTGAWETGAWETGARETGACDAGADDAPVELHPAIAIAVIRNGAARRLLVRMSLDLAADCWVVGVGGPTLAVTSSGRASVFPVPLRVHRSDG